MAAAARGRAARQEALRRRAYKTEQEFQLVQTAEICAAISPAEQASDAEEPATVMERAVIPGTSLISTDTPESARLEKVATIDGTEVQLTAHVKEVGGGTEGSVGKYTEMLIVAVDTKTRRSSSLLLEATDVRDIVDKGTDERLYSDAGKFGAATVFSAVLKRLTVFNSRRKDLFILSYRGKKVVAPH